MAEKTFVLHEDTGDEAKINELAAFMDDIEWEGSNSGISIYPVIDVRIGDTIVISDYGRDEKLVSVRRKRTGAPALEDTQDDGRSYHATILGDR
jgi:hypothetical protein